MKNEYQIEIDPLAVGLTKAPAFMGINMRLFFANVVICTMVCIDFHTVMGIPCFVIVHLFLLKQSLKDSNFFSIYLKALVKTPPVFNYWYWGKTNSYEPW